MSGELAVLPICRWHSQKASLRCAKLPQWGTADLGGMRVQGDNQNLEFIWQLTDKPVEWLKKRHGMHILLHANCSVPTGISELSFKGESIQSTLQESTLKITIVLPRRLPLPR